MKKLLLLSFATCIFTISSMAQADKTTTVEPTKKEQRKRGRGEGKAKMDDLNLTPEQKAKMEALRQEKYPQLADDLEAKLVPLGNVVSRVMSIRNKTIVHNERALSREKVYDINGITPNEIRELIHSTCEAINSVAHGLGLSNRISEGERHERATMAMLHTLRKGET